MTTRGRYTPRTDRPWYGSLDTMSHQEQEEVNKDWNRNHRSGPYLEKYRDIHDERFMQEHTCGKGDCGHHDIDPLKWDRSSPPRGRKTPKKRRDPSDYEWNDISRETIDSWFDGKNGMNDISRETIDSWFDDVE